MSDKTDDKIFAFPWKIAHDICGVATIRDADGLLVCRARSANAHRIVDAVNWYAPCEQELEVEELGRLRAEVAEAGELLQTWLCEAPGHRETVAWLKRNGFDDPFPECTEEDHAQ